MLLKKYVKNLFLPKVKQQLLFVSKWNLILNYKTYLVSVIICSPFYFKSLLLIYGSIIFVVLDHVS